ncbi:dTDP-4-dehydrorhamnose reductase [Actinopolymorpha cephalotaxi]|uniref:dTDP-4-dehydrorhamnose reductase n=1 Tax=Actinopolymorpha cephalotaxi TaxID=504797 RepID=A0A1I2Q0N8_9ACTN|nr:sugar nucleotide-binding protein [Actinopolymorpha cephalotaxi]NYH83400.1 dTDP-4-dehydrorhamnose reductase [Actinopolymorpha cephalotaxi]SFG21942.1 dTDP-4-dehydrorhamnose reductase [Actinopolymorpha cephalotaxi]
MIRILVVGGSGYLGAEVVRQSVAADDEVVATYASRPVVSPAVGWRAVDIRRRSDVVALVADVRPDVVVNAAYVKPDWRTNADGAAHVAVAAAQVGARLVQVSSDAVFSGAASSYTENAVPDPLNPYGAAKAAAETAVAAIDPTAVVARTSLILGDGTSPHEAFVHAVATGVQDGVLFTDDVRCPVHVADLAAALLELAASGHAGVAHVAGPDPVSRYELGLLVAARDGLDPSLLPTGLRADLPVPGPLDVRLDCRRTQGLLRTRLRGAREFLAGPPGTPRTD